MITTLAVCVLSATAVAVGWRVNNGAGQPDSSELLRKVWGPLLESGTTVTLVVATPLQLIVRQFDGVALPIGDPPFLLPAPDVPEFRELFRRDALSEFRGVYLHPNTHSPLWGDIAGAFVVQKFLLAHGARPDLVPEDSIHPVALRERHAVIFGRGDYSHAVRAFQPGGGLTVEYLLEDRQMGIVLRDSRGRIERKFLRGQSGSRNFGLVTILSTGASQRELRRSMTFSGINSDGAQAGAEFFTSEIALERLDREFRGQGRQQWPRAYQIVVETQSVDTFPMRVQFTVARVLQ